MADTNGVNEMVPFLMVANMKDALRFYTEGLGFEIEQKWEPDGDIRWCQIRLGGCRLMLQEHRQHAGNPDKGMGVVLCIYCDDALALYDAFTVRGIEPEEPYVGNRLWVTRVVDPDGYKIDFESPTDVAEETKLSEWRTSESS